MRSNLNHRTVIMALSVIVLSCAWFIAPNSAQLAPHPYYVTSNVAWNVDQSTSVMSAGSNVFAYYNAQQTLFLSPMKPRVICRYDVSLGREITPINYTDTGLTGGSFGYDVTAMVPQQVATSYNRILLVARYQSTSTVLVTMNFTGYWMAATTINGIKGLDISRDGTNLVAVSTGSLITMYVGDTFQQVSSLPAASNQQFYGIGIKPDGSVIVAANSSGIPTMNKYDSGLNLLASYSATRVRALTTANFFVDQSDTMIWLGPVTKGEWHYLGLRDSSFAVQNAYNGSAIEPNQFGQFMVISYNASTNTRSLLTFNRTQTTSLPSSSTGSANPSGSDNSSSSSSDHRAMIGLAVAVAVLGAIVLALVAMMFCYRARGDKSNKHTTTMTGAREGSLNSPMV